MYFVYVLRSQRSGKLYKGQTQNLAERLSEHNRGKTQSTKPGIPWEVVHHEEFASREEALVREKYLKTAAGRRYLKNIIGRVGSPPD